MVGCSEQYKRVKMSKYRSLENTIRFGPINELSKTHNPKHGKKEKDMNDQVYAGSYRSQHFEVSPDAQRIYSDISKDISGDKVERSVKTQDQLFGIMKKVIASGYSTQQDIDAAEQLAKKIYDVTNDFEVKIDHSHVDKMLNDIKSKYKDTPQVVDSITPEELKKRFLNPEKEYITTEPNSDADADNKKGFHITRSKAIARQRYLNVGVDEQMSIKDLPKNLIESVKKFLVEKRKPSTKEEIVNVDGKKFKVVAENKGEDTVDSKGLPPDATERGKRHAKRKFPKGEDTVDSDGPPEKHPYVKTGKGAGKSKKNEEE